MSDTPDEGYFYIADLMTDMMSVLSQKVSALPDSVTKPAGAILIVLHPNVEAALAGHGGGLVAWANGLSHAEVFKHGALVLEQGADDWMAKEIRR